MSALEFTKAQGNGNDFLILERENLETLGIKGGNLSELARNICDRNFGIGADGIEVISHSKGKKAEYEIHLWNSDGSRAEISGNGTRCVAAYLTAFRDASENILIATGAGVRSMERKEANYPHYQFRMTTSASSCRILEEACFLNIEEGANAGTYFVITADVGNPQCICTRDDFDFDWHSLGRDIEQHNYFPNGTNVSFVELTEDYETTDVLDVRFWERGAGATLSSGTGSLGVAVAAKYYNWLHNPGRICTEGGEIIVDWDDDCFGLTGDARILARGSYELEQT